MKEKDFYKNAIIGHPVETMEGMEVYFIREVGNEKYPLLFYLEGEVIEYGKDGVHN